jgi:alpha-galactosidase
MDQAVTADPVGAKQVRYRIKAYKALLGPEAAVYGDHVELSAMTRVGNSWREHGEDFASTIGAGGVVGTKFVWPDPGPRFKAVNLTPEKDARWKKWIGVYNQKMLSKGTFLDLYTYGYDFPEAYVIEKDGQNVLRILRRQALARYSGVAGAKAWLVSCAGLCRGNGSWDSSGER